MKLAPSYLFSQSYIMHYACICEFVHEVKLQNRKYYSKSYISD